MNLKTIATILNSERDIQLCLMDEEIYSDIVKLAVERRGVIVLVVPMKEYIKKIKDKLLYYLGFAVTCCQTIKDSVYISLKNGTTISIMFYYERFDMQVLGYTVDTAILWDIEMLTIKCWETIYPRLNGSAHFIIF